MTQIHQSSTEASPRRSKASKKWLIYGGLGLLTLIIIITNGPIISDPIQRFISIIENQYQQWFVQQDTANPIVLLPLAFVGGLLASISPCILALLPINLSYIGTLNIESRWDAFRKAGLFVLGSVTILSLLGLVSSFAGVVMVEYRGYINVIVGLIMAVMGLWLMGVVKLPLPQMNVNLPQAGPYGVGLTFALVSSPCASPVLFGVLAAAAATGSQLLGSLTMISYALGYTMLIFLASLFTGLAKQSKQLLQHSETIIRLGSVALIMTGVYYLFTGTQWFVGG
ncbi:cytochrome c biogenesis protein CcdA [Crocosphaera sp. XPORK-15E]|uniref:cytochrome c biogenesis protein CcdA n=1 Tax=Crocosphaera sp. XPORK-15E TaxID=3110247 RepID=UPI002B1EDB1A|nr:cytochrome c biogenesis protein CcdA [Crocosphaera sp. XPORK-15E]MEA5535505.1 cytochrome c biogenesis protein CcdA [Crocosphaera sp. XPORK-15E]